MRNMRIYIVLSVFYAIYCFIIKRGFIYVNSNVLNIVDILYPLSIIKINLFILIYSNKQNEDRYHFLLLFSVVETILFFISLFIMLFTL